MTIEIENYIIEPSESSSIKFDLKQKVTRTKKGGEDQQEKETYEGEAELGYSMSLEHCLKIIIHANLKKINKVVTFKEFLQEYVKEKQKLEQLIQNLETIKTN